MLGCRLGVSGSYEDMAGIAVVGCREEKCALMKRAQVEFEMVSLGA
jgi:hypothetical protein